MIRIETEIAMAAPPERVWAALCDLASYPAWNPFVIAASGDLRPGGRLSIRVRAPDGSGRVLGFTPVVTVFEPGKMLAWRGGFVLPAIFDGVHYYRLGPAGQSGTHFVHGESFGGLVTSLMGRRRIEAFRPAYAAMNEALARRVAG